MQACFFIFGSSGFLQIFYIYFSSLFFSLLAFCCSSPSYFFLIFSACFFVFASNLVSSGLLKIFIMYFSFFLFRPFNILLPFISEFQSYFYNNLLNSLRFFCSSFHIFLSCVLLKHNNIGTSTDFINSYEYLIRFNLV